MPFQSIDRPGFVYFVHAEAVGLVKIGFSGKIPEKRFSSLVVSSPIALTRMGYIKGSRRIEREVHARFAPARRHGEWFELSPELHSFIREVSEPWLKPEPKAPTYAYYSYGRAVPYRKLMKAKMAGETN